MSSSNIRPVRISITLTAKEAEALDKIRKETSRPEYIRRLIKGAKSAPIDPAYVAALEDENAAFSAREDENANMSRMLTAENKHMEEEIAKLREELEEAVEGSHIWQEEYETCQHCVCQKENVAKGHEKGEQRQRRR